GWRPGSGENNMTHSAGQLSELSWDDVPRLMEELQDMARRLLDRWPGMNSLQPTLLVNTALRRQRRAEPAWEEGTWVNTAHVFCQVSQAMHHKLVEYRRHQQTRGYKAQRKVSVAEIDLFEAWRRWTLDPDLILLLQAALEQLTAKSPELAQV